MCAIPQSLEREDCSPAIPPAVGNDRAFYIRSKRMVDLFLLASGNYGKAPRFEDRRYNVGVL